MSRTLFKKRRIYRDALRSFFFERGFEEVETPVLVPAPGQEPYLDPFHTRLDDGKSGQDRYLITSPEYYHKRLLAAGYEKIFEIARVFRNGSSETKGLHHVEFTMVEWYRAYASYLEIMEDLENLIYFLAQTGGSPNAEKLKPPFPRISMSDAFRQYAGVDLKPFLKNDPNFALAENKAGFCGITEADELPVRFFKIFITKVEPNLGTSNPVFLLDFPSSQASLSKVREDDPDLCERFELYIHGVELANGFTELNDPVEQQNRFEKEAKERAARGGCPVPQDPAFLEALELGMPPSGGVALGLDRLLMVLMGEQELSAVLPFRHIHSQSEKE
ncbi:MAG: EF-P lysine aminoacylase EpmA [Planctomycetota bacterium]